ncbi:TetR/AcrR family transcriptional regulator [Xanthomonas oryzae]|uniref:TetR/AcrR family transcriptional regulator n=1 Tax=Xanthomonas oryzae TaxID=347 RepID=UPI000CA035CF|nr:TetR/AcrR family transcriptional regulator [Xanthomonas oryzae]PNR68968.1 TetR family transcriptional regulator [Xanthomonas oryzae pv. oryzae]PNR74259.1 TetR family transcriptional regulator [Xanthomonas oryzae pv. oryzae]PNR76067.1 TetR family transcriptional regulator [Xanthomonas oryzae pv. oryzae]PNR86154.1 TetR family transcriptional regulator [Xanthomonas oryzae pv. oryzae]RBA65882.1 TetR/AcrR family transcriptional regulator [Xanthomonas oryzae pv. oryzae]
MSSSPTLNSKAKSNGPGRPKDLGKRAAILGAARAMFMELGYAGVSMDGIAARAGVSKLTVYSHFGDKESLFSEAIRAQCQHMMPDDLFDHAPKGALRDQLTEIAHAFFAMVSTESAISTHRMMMAPGTGDVHIREMFWDAGPKRTQRALADFLSTRVADGQLEIPDVTRAASQFFSLLKGELYALMMCGLQGPPTPAQVDEHIDTSVDFFLRAYAPR